MADKTLINLIRKRAVLYDRSRCDFRDLQKKAKAWAEISAIMKFPVADIKKRWKLIRDRYARTRRGEMLHSGDESSAPGVQWELMPLLSFLGDFVKHRRGHMNLTTTSLTPDTPETSTSSWISPLDGQQLDTDEDVNPEMETEMDLNSQSPSTGVPPHNDSTDHGSPFPAAEGSGASTNRPPSATSQHSPAPPNSDVPSPVMDAPPDVSFKAKRRRSEARQGRDTIEEALAGAFKIPRTEEESFGDMMTTKIRTIPQRHRRRAMLEMLMKMTELQDQYDEDENLQPQRLCSTIYLNDKIE